MTTTRQPSGRRPHTRSGTRPEEYERLRAQARMWEAATGRLLDQIGLGPGASCLDAGCGPGETMRAMAERVGPAGRVLGIDADASLGAHGAGHAARRRPPAVRLPRAGPHRRRADPRRTVRPRVRAAAAVPPAAARRGAGPAVGGGRPGRSSAGPGLRPAQRSARCPSWTAWPSGLGWLPVRSARRARTCRPVPGCRSCSRRPASGLPTAPTSPAASSRSPPRRTSWSSVVRSVLPTALAHGVTTEARRAARAGLDRPRRRPLPATARCCGRC